MRIDGRWNWTPTEPGAEACSFWLTFHYQAYNRAHKPGPLSRKAEYEDR